MEINIPEAPSGKKRVVIVGAGFAGLRLAIRLARAAKHQIVLIDRNNYHQFQPLFYQVAMAGLEPSSIVFPIRKLFQGKKDVFFRVTSVESVDTSAKTIHTRLGPLAYDYLVIATGAETNFFGNQHIAEKAIPMKSVSEALFLRNTILDDYEKALSEPDFDARQGLIDIVVVGGGPTGVEVSGALAEMRKFILPKDYKELDPKEMDIYLIEGTGALLGGMKPGSSEAAYRFLEQLGVNVKLNTFVTDYDGEWVTMGDGAKIRSRKVIWAAGIIGNKLEGLPAGAIVRGNRVKTDRYHRVEGLEDVFAIGDIAWMPEEKYPNGHPQVAQVALQMAKNLSGNLLSKPKSFSYLDKGSMATIGRHLAVADLPGIRMKGSLAWFIWLFVHLFSLIGTKNRVFVFVNWVWNYLTYDQSLRLIIRPRNPQPRS